MGVPLVAHYFCAEEVMATKNRRINMVLDDSLFQVVEELPSRRGSSLSAVARDLVADVQEDE